MAGAVDPLLYSRRNDMGVVTLCCRSLTWTNIFVNNSSEIILAETYRKESMNEVSLDARQWFSLHHHSVGFIFFC